MPNNWCKNVVLLFKVDLITGEKEVINIFASTRSAAKYRRHKFFDEAFKKGKSLNDLYPIEKWRVTIQSEVE